MSSRAHNSIAEDRSENPALTREDLRSMALHSAIARKLLQAPQSIIARAERNVCKMMTVHGDSVRLLETWKSLLTMDPSLLARMLVLPDPLMRELRHVTPFAGVLTARERTVVFREFQRDEGSDK